LVINAAKSFIYFGGVGADLKQVIPHDTGFSEGIFPFKYLGVPLSLHKLLVSQFSLLFHKLEAAVQSWTRKHLSYAGKLELLRSVLFSIVQFWLGIFPILGTVISHIISLCRIFLWSGNINSHNSTAVAWKKTCLPKYEGGLGLLDIKARNKSFLAKQLWNIHLKTNFIWILWIHHFYLNGCSIWEVHSHRTSSPMWKSIISLKDELVKCCEGQAATITLMSGWYSSAEHFLPSAYDFLRARGAKVAWDRVVWEPWSMPRYNFIL
jgi:hypothetical protein